MNEKRKRLDLNEVRLMLEAERENAAVKRASRAEQIALHAMHAIADGYYSISGDEIRVAFTIWDRTVWQYDSAMLDSVLKDNGLMISDDRVYLSEALDWNFAWFGMAVCFNMRLQLYKEPEPSRMESLIRAADDYLNEVTP